MNNYYTLGFTAVVLLVLILFTIGEFKASEYVPTIHSHGRGSGLTMHTYGNLGVPGWKWDDCCIG
jgi:hypothetical protein